MRNPDSPQDTSLGIVEVEEADDGVGQPQDLLGVGRREDDGQALVRHATQMPVEIRAYPG